MCIRRQKAAGSSSDAETEAEAIKGTLFRAPIDHHPSPIAHRQGNDLKAKGKTQDARQAAVSTYQASSPAVRPSSAADAVSQLHVHVHVSSLLVCLVSSRPIALHLTSQVCIRSSDLRIPGQAWRFYELQSMGFRGSILAGATASIPDLPRAQTRMPSLHRPRRLTTGYWLLATGNSDLGPQTLDDSSSRRPVSCVSQ